MTYGTNRVNAYRLLENALNLRDTKVFDYHEEEGKRVAVLNKKETMLAAQKQDLIKEEFKKWVFKERTRRNYLVKLYNEKFNSIRLREYDAVIIGHSQFEKIPMSKEYQQTHIQQELDEMIAHISALKAKEGQRISVKQLVKTRKKLEVKLEKLNDDFKKDDVVTFEELGIDKLYVDEAHSFKNLFYILK